MSCQYSINSIIEDSHRSIALHLEGLYRHPGGGSNQKTSTHQDIPYISGLTQEDGAMRGGGRTSSHLPRPSSFYCPRHLLPAANPPHLLLCVCLIIITTGSHAQCPLGVGHDGKCYVMQSGTRSWSDARALCATLSGTLPVVNDDVTQEVITGLMKEEGTASIWLGAEGQNGDWYWASSGEVIGPQSCFFDSPWSPALEKIATIPNMTPGLCMDTCRQAGATYAAIQSKENCHCGDNYPYGQGGLTGCTIPCPGDGQQYCGGWGKSSVYAVDGAYGKWSYSQPDGANDACAVMDTYGNNRKFADEACFRKKPYFCDIPMSSCRAPDVGYYVMASVCLYVGSDMTWWEARGACKKRDGTLLVVKSTSHHDVIRRLLNGTGIDGAHWIGLTRSTWTWSDKGETLSWAGWANRSPSGQSGRCLSVTSSSGFKWVDSGCGQLLGTVCAVAAPSTTTDPPTSPIPSTTSLYPPPTTPNLPIQTTELSTQSEPTSLNSAISGPSTASSLTTLEQTVEQTLEQTTLTYISTSIENLGDKALESTIVSTQMVTQKSSTTQTPSDITTEMTSTHKSSTDAQLAGSTQQTVDSASVSQNGTTESITQTTDSSTINATPSTEGQSTKLVTTEDKETTVAALSSTEVDISQYFTTAIAGEHSVVSSTENVIVKTSQNEETTSQLPKDLSTVFNIYMQNHTQSGLSSEAITNWGTNNPSSATTNVEDFSTGTTSFHMESTEGTTKPTMVPPSGSSTYYFGFSSTGENTYQSTVPDEISTAITVDDTFTQTTSMGDISVEPTDPTTENSSRTNQNVTGTVIVTQESGMISSTKTNSYTFLTSTPATRVSPSTAKQSTKASDVTTTKASDVTTTKAPDVTTTKASDVTTRLSKMLTSEQEPVIPTEATSEAPTPTAKTTITTTTVEFLETSLSTTDSQTTQTSNLAGISTLDAQLSSAVTSPTISVTKSIILSTLASSTLRFPTRGNKTPVDDVTTDVDLTSIGDVNSTSTSEVPGVRGKQDDDNGLSVFEIGVVAVLVALALGLATSMVVFLSCKKRGGGSCRKKSNKTDSVQTTTDLFTAGGATSGHVTLGNGSVQNGCTHGPVGNGLSEKQRRKSEQYSIDVTAETKDLTTMEDISVGIGDTKRGKKQKSKRNGNVINGGAATRGRNGPGPPSTWSTLPKYYYGMDKYNGAYSGGYYDNQEFPDHELMQHPLPVRQEVFFRMSQVFSDPHQGVTNQDNQQHPGSGVGNSMPSDHSMPLAPPICVLDANGLNYEASSTYYDAFDPEQNTYSSTFPCYARNGTPNGGNVNGLVSQDPAGPERNRLYEQSGQGRAYGQPNYYEKKKSARVPPRTKVPADGDGESVVGRQDSFSSHYSFTDDTMPTTASPDRSSNINRALERNPSGASRHVPQSDLQSSPVSENTVSIPSASMHGSQTGSLHQKPRPADVVIPVAPRLPGASQPPPPPKRSPPAPPPRRSSTSTTDRNAIYTKPNRTFKQNGYPQELQGNGQKFFRLKAAEEGITWC